MVRQVDNRTCLQHLGHRIFNPFPCIFVQDAKYFIQRPAISFDSGPAGKQFGCRVHYFHVSTDITDDYSVADAPEDDAVLCFLLEPLPIKSLLVLLPDCHTNDTCKRYESKYCNQEED